MSSVNVSTSMECEVMPKLCDYIMKELKFFKPQSAIISFKYFIFFFSAILVLYLTRKLAYTDDDATVLFHVFTSFAYFFPLIGAIVADSWLGRFK